MLRARSTLLVLLSTATFGSSAFAAEDPADISGSWLFEVDIAGQTGTPFFTFEQDGEELTGQYQGQFGEAEVTGKVTGDKVEFSFGLEGQKATYTGTITQGGSMEGETDYAGQATGTWTATKIDITGNWIFEVDIAGQTGTPFFTFKQDGEKLTGHYTGQFGEADVTGQVTGDEVEFSFGPEEQRATYKGTIQKGSMEGEADYAGQATGTWKAFKVDVTGTWEIEIEIGGSSGAPVFTLKQDGETITGQYQGQFGEAEVTGKLTGNEVEFSFGPQGQVVVYKGKISGDTMTGEADYAGQATGSWTGKRKADN